MAVGIASALGWRGSFIAINIPIIVFGIVFYIMLGRWRHTRQAGHERPESYVETPSPPGHLRHLIAFLTLGVVGYVCIFSTISFLPLFAVDNLGVSEGTGAVLLAVVNAAGLWGGPLGGYLSDRLGGVTVLLVASLIAGPILYLLTLASYNWGIYALLLIAGMSMFIIMPVSEAYIVGRVSERRRSTVLGVYYFASRGGPGLLMPVMGYLIDQFGFSVSFTVIGAALVAVTLGCAAFLWGKRG